MFVNKYTPLISEPTRYTTTNCTLIDNTFTNSSNNILNPGIIINDMSDHLPAFCSVKGSDVNINKIDRYVHYYVLCNCKRTIKEASMI